MLFLFISESSTGDIKSTDVDDSQMEKFAIKTSDSNNDRILTGEELNQVPTAKPDGITGRNFKNPQILKAVGKLCDFYHLEWKAMATSHTSQSLHQCNARE